jgi:hypothetical protein
LPAQFPQFSLDPPVPFDITLELFSPEPLLCLRHVCQLATPMPVPKASMHENGDLAFRQYHIRPTWQVTPVQAETVPHPV